jgi:signal transduction histidine kinase/ABC-type multidrug transport system ATPase subunit
MPPAPGTAPDGRVVLRVRGLSKRFGALQVLRGVDLELAAGEILALVGENGAGKSTLVKCLARTYTPDTGTVELLGEPVGDVDRAISVVWQDLALCDNLSAVSNLFLGTERTRSVLLDEVSMVGEAVALFDRLHMTIRNPQAPVGTLSGGERQLLAIARALRHSPRVLVLDEPTASLGVWETAMVERSLAQLRGEGTAILLVSHRLEQVFNVADRIAVLRTGRIVAEVSPLEVHPDDVAALISGIEADSTARRQLHLLQSLVEQLAEVEPAASLPLILSAMSEALGVDQLCLHLLEAREGDPAPMLRRSAVVGRSTPLLDAEWLSIGEAGGPPGIAAATGCPVIVEHVRHDPRWAPFRDPTGDPGPRSSWSLPITGSFGLLGTISGFSDTAGRPQPDQLELVSLYASHAAAAIDREHLLAEATKRNRMLETLRGILDTLAGPESAQGGLGVALLALCRGLGADSISMHYPDGDRTELWATDMGEAASALAIARQRRAAESLLASTGRVDRARPVGEDVLAVRIAAPLGRAVVTAWWGDVGRVSDEALDLLDDAARSLRMALEREALEQANAEAASLRRSQGLQREFLSRLNHELRTPLTAIQGFASTLRQTDVSWDTWSQQRFLDSIANESARMGRLVGDLLDFSAIDSGTLRLIPDWCDLGLVLEAARRCVTDAVAWPLELPDGAGLPPIWADHDRLEQVFVNLFENAARHARGVKRVKVTAVVDPGSDNVVVRVHDDGHGIGPELAARVFLPHERGPTDGPGAGLGLAIARGIVDAHRGTIELEPVPVGTCIRIGLPLEPAAGAAPGSDLLGSDLLMDEPKHA